MAEKGKQDMGTGSVKRLMVQMAVPAVVGQVINLLYNVVDRIYIGHIPEIGGAALTGVGLFTPILMLITAFAMLAGAGGAPRAAIAMACLRKLILLIPLIFILPNFFADKAFAVFLAEPVSDILAATVTTITFFTFFRRLLCGGKTK